MTTDEAAPGDGRTKQHAVAYDQAQQAIGGPGSTIYANFGGPPSPEAEAAITLAPPLGRRDGRSPLRGRTDLVTELIDSRPGVHVLHGMGGCGKTSIALEVAALVGVEDVWWVSAARADQLQAGMRALARRLGLADEQLRQGDVADLVWQRLAARPGRWLLVIDNADDPRLLANGQDVRIGTGWLRPNTGHGLVIVTSRDGHAATWGPWCIRHRVTVLPRDDAAQVLFDRAGLQAGTLEEAGTLAARLGGLPLALRLAGSYLAEAMAVPRAFAEPEMIRSYTDFLATIEGGGLSLAFPEPGGELTPQRARGLIGRTWDLSLDLLESRDMPEARPLLRLLACFADAPIPYALVLRPDVLAASDLFPAMTGQRLWKALQALASLDLIDLADSADGIEEVEVLRLHPLVRDASHPAGVDARRVVALTAELLEQAAQSEETGLPEDPSTWPLWQSLTSHVFYLLDLACSELDSDVLSGHELEVVTSARLAGRYLAAKGAYSRALEHLEQVLGLSRRALGGEHPEVLGARRSVARVMAEQGRFVEAERELREVLVDRVRLLGTDDPDTLAARHELAWVMAEQGRVSEAEKEFREVLAAAVRRLGNDHPNTLATRHSIAWVMARQKRFDEAEAEFREVLLAEVRVLGDGHPTSLPTRHEIARMMAEQGRLSEAESEFRELLVAGVRMLGADHPDTLMTQHSVAWVMAKQKRFVEAEKGLQEVLAAKVRVLGDDHPSTLITKRALDDLLRRTAGDSA